MTMRKVVLAAGIFLAGIVGGWMLLERHRGPGTCARRRRLPRCRRLPGKMA